MNELLGHTQTTEGGGHFDRMCNVRKLIWMASVNENVD